MQSIYRQDEFMQLPGGPDFPVVTDVNKIDGYELLNEEQKKKVRTECKIAEGGDSMSQLVDRIASDSFQG